MPAPATYSLGFHSDASDHTIHLEVAAQRRLGCAGVEAMAVQTVSRQRFPPFQHSQRLLVASPLDVIAHRHL